MTQETNFENRINKNLSVLKKIADNYSKNSEEEKLLRLASLAYFFVTCKYEVQFNQYLDNLNKPLSETEKAFLKKIGVKSSDYT